MKRQVRGVLLVIAVASALAACASTTPVESNAMASESSSAPAGAGVAVTTPAVSAPADAASIVPAGAAEAAAETDASLSTATITASKAYRRVVKNGQEYFCRREGVTGSRVQSVETCLTQAQLVEQVRSNQEIMRRMQDGPREAPPQTDDPTVLMQQR